MSNPQTGKLATALQHAHREWRKEVGEALAPVQVPEAGIWERASAARYLVDEFVPRLDREAHVLSELADQLPPRESGHVWALGELLQYLCRHLSELGCIAQCGPAFAAGVTKLIRALDVWCAEVEAAVSSAETDGLAPEAIEQFQPVLAESLLATA